MRATLSFLLCISTLIPGSLTKEVDCGQFDSAFLNCACNALKSANKNVSAAKRPTPRTTDQNRFDDVIDTICESPPALQKCVDSGLMSSMNPLDVFIRQMFDLGHLETALTPVCNKISDVKDMFPCMMTKRKEIGHCFGSPQKWNLSLGTLGFVESKTLCVINNVIATCDASVAAAFRNLFLAFMRTDSNSVPNGTLRSVEGELSSLSKRSLLDAGIGIASSVLPFGGVIKGAYDVIKDGVSDHDQEFQGQDQDEEDVYRPVNKDRWDVDYQKFMTAKNTATTHQLFTPMVATTFLVFFSLL